MTPADVARIEKIVAEAEGAFRRAPKAMWSERSYLAPKDATAIRAMLNVAPPSIDRGRG